LRFKLITAIFLSVLLAGCGGEKKLVLYTWSDMFPSEILTGFEKEKGIKLNYVNFDTDETMMTKLQTAKGGEYDLVIADDYMVENVIKEGLAKKLDHSKLSGYHNINPIYQKQFYDPSDEYTVPYGAGIQTIVYDPQKINFPIKGYADLWNPLLAQKLGIIDNFRVINGMALKVLGQSYNTGDLDQIRKAGDLLKSLAPNIRLIRNEKLEEEILSGEISAGVMYTSQVTMAKMGKPELAVVFPQEGLGFGIMAAFIPSKAPDTDSAYAFLDYILDAQRGARCFETLGYYSTFSASDQFIDPKFRDFLTLPKDFSNFAAMEMIQNVSPEAEALHDRVYTEFKAATGK